MNRGTAPFDPDDPRDAPRLEVQYRRLGTRTPACAWPGCGESNPFALFGYTPDISCAAHHSLRNCRRPYEAHHVAGQHNSDVTAEIPINDHRILSEMQRVWPFDTLLNPDHSPLLVAAAAIRGWIDVMRVLIERALPWIPIFLEWLDEQLLHLLGEQWWRQLGWDSP